MQAVFAGESPIWVYGAIGGGAGLLVLLVVVLCVVIFRKRRAGRAPPSADVGLQRITLGFIDSLGQHLSDFVQRKSHRAIMARCKVLFFDTRTALNWHVVSV